MREGNAKCAERRIDARMCKMMSEDAQRCENLTRRCAKLTQRCAKRDVEMRGCDESVSRKENLCQIVFAKVKWKEKLCQIVLPRSNRRKNQCQFMYHLDGGGK